MKIGFFVPCYIDAIAPQAAISSFKLLQRLGLNPEFIESAACCGLPLKDMGYTHSACKVESSAAAHLAGFDYIVMPSGICADQFRNHFDDLPQLLRKLKDYFSKVLQFPEQYEYEIAIAFGHKAVTKEPHTYDAQTQVTYL